MATRRRSPAPEGPASAAPLPYLSAAWAAAAKRHVEAHPRFADVVRGVEASLLTLVEGPPPGAEEAFLVRVADGALDLACGSLAEVRRAGEPEFEVRADYATLAAIQRGELSEVAALVSRKARLRGSLLDALRRLPTLRALNELVREVPTRTRPAD